MFTKATIFPKEQFATQTTSKSNFPPIILPRFLLNTRAHTHTHTYTNQNPTPSLISREESTYPSGNEFLPDRWLNPAYPTTYKEPLTEFPNLNNDRGFGYGNRSCPGVELTQCELFTLIGHLIWAFDIRRCEGKSAAENPVPWYETAPWVITMPKPFKCEIRVRSEEKKRWIEGNCPDGGGLVRDTEKERRNRWDVIRPRPRGGEEEGEEHFNWEGLTDRASGHAGRVYGVGV